MNRRITININQVHLIYHSARANSAYAFLYRQWKMITFYLCMSFTLLIFAHISSPSIVPYEFLFVPAVATIVVSVIFYFSKTSRAKTAREEANLATRAFGLDTSSFNDGYFFTVFIPALVRDGYIDEDHFRIEYGDSAPLDVFQ